MKAKRECRDGHALRFRNTDYLMMIDLLVRKNSLYLVKAMVPIGEDQIKLTWEERAELLRTKIRRVSEAEIQDKFYGRKIE